MFGAPTTFGTMLAPPPTAGAIMPSTGGRAGGGALTVAPSVVGGALPMDIVETENNYEVYADAPGMSPHDVKVEVGGDTACACGEQGKVDARSGGGRQGRGGASYACYLRIGGLQRWGGGRQGPPWHGPAAPVARAWFACLGASSRPASGAGGGRVGDGGRRVRSASRAGSCLSALTHPTRVPCRPCPPSPLLPIPLHSCTRAC